AYTPRAVRQVTRTMRTRVASRFRAGSLARFGGACSGMGLGFEKVPSVKFVGGVESRDISKLLVKDEDCTGSKPISRAPEWREAYPWYAAWIIVVGAGGGLNLNNRSGRGGAPPPQPSPARGEGERIAPSPPCGGGLGWGAQVAGPFRIGRCRPGEDSACAL